MLHAQNVVLAALCVLANPFHLATAAPQREAIGAGSENEEPEPPPLAELRGRFLLPDGRPAAGVEVSVHGWRANSERVMQFGRPKGWKDPSGKTDADGRFSFSFDPPRAYQFALDAKLRGYVEVSWRWHELPQGELTDLGDVRLTQGGTIAGRLVDPDGQPLGDGWTIYLDTAYASPGSGSDTTRARARVDPRTGEFELGDVPPGRVRLEAYHPGANYVDGPQPMVRAGERVEVPFVYEGPDNRRRVTIRTFARPFHVFDDLEEGAIRVIGGRCSPCVAKRVEGSSQSYSVDDLDAGTYRVEIEHPYFLPWSRDGVEPGTTVDARLEGSASIVLTVLDEATGQPIQGGRVKLRFDGANFRPNLFELTRFTKDAGLIEGLIPGVQSTLIVEAEGYAPVEHDLGELPAGQTRPVVVDLGAGAVVSGVVLAGGQPVPDVRVELGPRRPEGRVRFMRRRDRSGRVIESDAQGRFAFRAVAPGEYTLEARRNALVKGRRDLVVAEAESQDVDVGLPESGFVRGRLVAPAGAPAGAFARMRVSVEDRSWPWREGGDPTLAIPTARVDASGGFRLGPLPAGEVSLIAALPDAEVHGFGGSSTVPGPMRSLGVCSIPAGGVLTSSFDLQDRVPGSIRVHVTSSPGLAELLAESTTGALYAWAREAGASRHSGAVVARVEPDGTALLGPLFGGAWTVEVGSANGWRVLATGTTLVLPAEEAQVGVHVAIVEASLGVQDKDGSPVASRRVFLRNPGAWQTWIQGQTDESGRVTLRIPPGEYLVMDGGPLEGMALPAMQGVPLTWTEAGPQPATVQIELDANVFEVRGEGSR